MPKTLQPNELEQIIQPLPSKDRTALRQQDLTPQWLEDKIAACKSLINRDLWFGIPWFIIYGASLIVRGFDNVTIVIFAVGMAYFLYTMFTTGSSGLNRKRIKIYEELRNKLN